MSFEDLVNAQVTVKRHVRTGADDGTPQFDTTDIVHRVWFDEAAAEDLNTVDRGGVPQVVRRAVVMLRSDQVLLSDDDLHVVMDGPTGAAGAGQDLGIWHVDVIRMAPDSYGLAHWEVTVSKVRESG